MTRNEPRKQSLVDTIDLAAYGERIQFNGNTGLSALDKKIGA
jgi:hypothetical protein